MPERFPAIEPYETGMLDVGDGQRIYWEASGNPAGKPAVALHGGPGGGSSPGRRRSFDPAAYRFVQFDQRGCGQSTPPASALDTSLETNTTEHLIGDIEKLRVHLGIERWLVWGASWGVTLGLAYAQRYPERVTEMVLVSVTMTRPYDVHWLYHETGRFFPDEWSRFAAAGGDAPDLVAAYDRLLNGSFPAAVRERAARDWCAWEDALVSLEEGWTPYERFTDPAFRMAFARLCAHYFSHAAWLEDGQLLRDAGRLAGIPGVLIHGRFDIGGPPDVPWLLHRAWPGSELYLVRTGHQGGDEMTERVLEALNRFARRQALPGVLADAGYPGADPVDQLVRLVLGDLDEVVLEVTAFGGYQGGTTFPRKIPGKGFIAPSTGLEVDATEHSGRLLAVAQIIHDGVVHHPIRHSLFSLGGRE